MSSPVSSQSWPLLNRQFDTLYQRENYVFADFPGSDRFIGFDAASAFGGTATAIQSAAAFWDVRQYSQVQLWAYVPGFAGDAAGYIQFGLEMGPTATATAIYGLSSTGNTGITSTIATVVVAAGTPVAAASLAGGSYSGSAVMAPILPPFVRIKHWRSGTSTSITSGAVYLFGIR